MTAPNEIGEPPADICGLCGGPGADKIPHPTYWPGEQIPDSRYVHSVCEYREAEAAMLRLSDYERRQFLKSL